MTIPPTIVRWHPPSLRYGATRRIALERRASFDELRMRELAGILAEDVTFESPVAPTPQVGRAIVEGSSLKTHSAFSALRAPLLTCAGR